MSPLWVLPLLIVTLGAVALVWAARSTAAAAAELADRAGALGDLGREASALRAEVDAVAARARGLEFRRSSPEHEPS